MSARLNRADIDGEILRRVEIGKRSAKRLLSQTHHEATRKHPRERLTKEEIKLNKHNAWAERRYCGLLLRAGRKGLNAIQAHWFANAAERRTA